MVAYCKSGFCLGDRYPVRTRSVAAEPAKPVFTSRCGLEQSQSRQRPRGHLARLRRRLRGESRRQHLLLNGLRAGRYLLVHRVNVDRRLRESAYDNNASSLLLTLRRGDGVPRMRVLAVCPETEDCSAARSR